MWGFNGHSGGGVNVVGVCKCITKHKGRTPVLVRTRSWRPGGVRGCPSLGGVRGVWVLGCSETGGGGTDEPLYCRGETTLGPFSFLDPVPQVEPSGHSGRSSDRDRPLSS